MRVTPESPADGRTRRKRAAMARVQAAALDLFEARGYDAVSIEEVARAADVGPATVYRNFGGKERVVLWDEYDPLLLQALAAELGEHGVIEATGRALASSLGEVYRADRARILRRSRLVRATPALQVAAMADVRALKAALAATLRASRRARDELSAQVFAGALVAAIEAGIDRWLDGDGGEPLARCFTRALAKLRRLVDA